jgi:NAD(P)-dependent dehydrogenase (short-subunit alcohol dehydrogenase family)
MSIVNRRLLPNASHATCMTLSTILLPLVSYRLPEGTAQATNSRGTLSALQLDVTKEADIEAAVEQASSTFGHVDVLINKVFHHKCAMPWLQILQPLQQWSKRLNPG